MTRNLKHILLKSWFLALLIAIVVMLLLPDIFSKYKIVVVEQQKLPNPTALDNRVYFEDLNNDGNCEKILSFVSKDQLHSIQVYTKDGGIIGQWNFTGKPPGDESRLGFFDADQNGLKEIYAFARYEDTIMLNGLEPFNNMNPVLFTDYKITELSRKYAEPDCHIHEIIFHDFTMDGQPDLFFTISSGFALIPRKLFILDVHNQKLKGTDNFGSIITNISLTDLDKDGRVEIMGRNVAAGNVEDSLGIPYDDYSAYIMAFDSKLELLFEPVKFPGFRSTIQAQPIKRNGKNLIAAYYYHVGSMKNIPKLLMLNHNGKIIDSVVMHEAPKINHTFLVTDGEENQILNILNDYGQIQKYNLKLEKITSYDLNHNVLSGYIKQSDLNGNDRKEIIMLTQQQSGVLITDYDLSYPAILPLDLQKGKVFLSPLHCKINGADLVVSDNQKYYLLDYTYNQLYPLRFAIYAGIFLFIWLFILLIRKLQLIQLEKKNRIRNEIVQLQLKNMKNQMNPHFTFNVFNAIASKIRKENPKTYPDFIQFSKLIRNTLESSDKITRSLSEEISYLDSYLELEKLRFPNKFDYKIEMDDGIDTSTKVPKMILQTYVENAIKHGIRHKEGKGHIKVSITSDQKNIIISIQDDGIGRAKAKELSTDSTGFGLQIMDNYYKLFNEYNEARIAHEIVDLYDDNGKPSGTKVVVSIPLKFSYRI
ncbi:MAG: histidine kinase [Bacteroidales bacterium]|nr:histidine kinase [Bacteroidales bacterium]MCF8343536.1 histidine kinase [Bacteroidales bacterium]MCF8349827.1 histidine kinase [Bacteroidales bacterium]MCF8375947.1 histidine kinase [Bacteroidales bacterium]